MKYIWSDIDGDLVSIDREGAIHYGKKLSLEVAWHVDMFEELEQIPGELIQYVDLEFVDNYLLIHYNALIKPLSLEEIRTLLTLDQPFGIYRLAKCSLDLCHSLSRLHNSGIYQMVIHPQRLGQLENSFVILPTLAGVLPPFSLIGEMKNRDILHYLAPEVIRTRGDDPSLLPAADIYSLGRTLQVLGSFDWSPGPIEKVLEYLESYVEFSEVRQPENLITDNGHFSDLIKDMCSYFPEERPPLAEIIGRLENKIISSEDPKNLLQHFMHTNQFKLFMKSLAVFEEMQRSELFSFPKEDLYRVKADFELAQSPPEYLKAIGQLVKINSIDPYNVDVLLEIGQCYENISNQPQHLQLAADYYERAARLSHWRQDIVDIWLQLLNELANPQLIQQAIDDIPSTLQSPFIYKLRVRFAIGQGDYLEAWVSATQYFKISSFDQDIYGYAKQAAEHIEPLVLMALKKEYDGVDGLEPMVSIIWERNGNIAKARECFDPQNN